MSTMVPCIASMHFLTLLLLVCLTCTSTLVNSFSPPSYLVVWRGEGDKNYAPLTLRHLELSSSLTATSTNPLPPLPPLTFTDALDHTNLLQFLSCEMSPKDFAAAAKRCSTLRDGYLVLGSGDSFSTAANNAAANSLHLFTPLELTTASWSLRCRDYRGRKFGKQLASPLKSGVEREAIISSSNFTSFLQGPVKLKDPSLPIFSFILPSPPSSSEPPTYLLLLKFCTGFSNLRNYDPNTRLCVTSTPLEPIAAFTMANAGLVHNGSAVLDLYAGSATSLLASAALAPECKTVGIERDGDWLVNFTKVSEDFISRNLPPPTMVRGDSRDPTVRGQALAALPGSEGFDVILADPPYGKRERKDDDSEPLLEIFRAITKHRIEGRRLLKEGGR